MSDFVISIVVSGLAIVLCSALAWVFIKGYSRLRAETSSSLLCVLTTIKVGTREWVTVVSYREKEYILGVSASGICLIDKRDALTITEQE
jgi:flagellar biogenesis protein FliO